MPVKRLNENHKKAFLTRIRTDYTRIITNVFVPIRLFIRGNLCQEKVFQEILNKIAALAKSWLPVFLCMGFIFYTSSLAASDIPALFPFQDSAYHFLIYSALAFLFARALKMTRPGLEQAKAVLFSVIFGVMYGLSDELHQGFLPSRSVSCLDIFIDGIGSFAGSLIYGAYRWLR